MEVFLELGNRRLAQPSLNRSPEYMEKSYREGDSDVDEKGRRFRLTVDKNQTGYAESAARGFLSPRAHLVR